MTWKELMRAQQLERAGWLSANLARHSGSMVNLSRAAGMNRSWLYQLFKSHGIKPTGRTDGKRYGNRGNWSEHRL
jgi:AraC-like DNA-binding protein